MSRSGCWKRPCAVVALLGAAVVWVDPVSAQTDPRRNGPTEVNHGGDVITSRVAGIKLKRIPAGEFLMGGSEIEKKSYGGREEDFPRHRVRITRPFYLGVTEVTVAQFRRVVEVSGYRTDAERDGNGGWGWDDAMKEFRTDPKFTWREPGFARTDDHPVTNVSWNDAIAFCNALSEQEGLKPYYPLGPGSKRGGEGYRLPTEAEWEYACRAGTTSVYVCGNDEDALVTVGNISDGSYKEKYGDPALHVRDGYAETAPVGRFPPNAFGLHDMHGNVWEWCWDWYGSGYYQESPLDDPPGPPAGSERVLRGGGWSNFVQHARSAARRKGVPGYRLQSTGFRVARDLSAP